MKQAHNTHKGRELAIGFFSWLVFWSISYWVKDYLGIGVLTVIDGIRYGRPDLGGYWKYGFPLITIVVIGILFFMKKNWIAYGILSTVTINILGYVLIFSLLGASWGEVFSNWDGISMLLESGLSTPFFMVGGFY
jgi:hypothetical protein